MKKRLMASCVAFALVLTMSLQSFAATQDYSQRIPNPVNPYDSNGNPIDIRRGVSKITVEDLARLELVLNRQTVGTAPNQKQLGPVISYDANGNPAAKYDAKIINAVRLPGSDTEWVIRIDCEEDATIKGDYYVHAIPYECDNEGQPINVPTATGENGKYTKKYGPAWFYCGLFDDAGAHNIIGFAVAQRITRWPQWGDLQYGQWELTVRNPKYNPNSENPDERFEYIFTPTGFANDAASRLGLSIFNYRGFNQRIIGSYPFPSSSNWLADNTTKK